MSVERDPVTGTYRYRTTAYFADGSPKRISGSAPRYENTRAKALAMEAEHVKRIRALMPGQEEATKQTESPETEPTKPIVPTVAEFFGGYLDACRIDNAKSTIVNKESDYKRHILPALGHLRLDEVTYAVLEDFKLTLSKTVGRNRATCLSAKTIHNVQLHVSHMLGVAKKRGHIAAVPEIEWITVPPSEFDFLSFEEAKRLCSVPRDEWRTMIFVGLRTGLRKGELLGLRWIDVDLDAGRLMVRQNYVLGEFKGPKSGKPREVPLGDDVVAELRAHRHERGPLVFCDHRGEPWADHLLDAPLARATRYAGLRSIGWHTLRHTFASHLAMRGVALKIIQELLGHATIQTTMRYAHLMPGVVRDAVRVLDEPRTAGPAPSPAMPSPNSQANSSVGRAVLAEVANDWQNLGDSPLSN